MKPLTPQMQRALALLESTKNRALVRLWSQWWCVESEEKRARELGAFQRDPSGNLNGPAPNSIAASMNDDAWPVLMVNTATVNALIKRGQLKFKGKKRDRAELN